MNSARSSSAQSEEREITLADGTVIRGGRVAAQQQMSSAPRAVAGYSTTTQQFGTPVTTAQQYHSTTTTQQYGTPVQYSQHQVTSGQVQGSSAIRSAQYTQQQFGTPMQTSQQSRVVHQSGTITRQDMMAREISVHTLTGKETIIGERIVEHEVKVPKRIVREEIIEKVIVVPEKIVHEEVIEETQKVREKVIEVAKPIYQETVIEVPEIEYVEKIIEVPERVVQEKIREVPRYEVQERIVEVPKIIHQEKIVEVPEIEYREVPIEKIIEVPQIQEQVVFREVAVPQYVDKPVPEHVTVEVPHKIERNIPIPVEAVTTFEYRLPHIRPHYKKASFPVYVPRFVEVPVPEELVEGVVGAQASHLAKHVELLTTQAAPSLCEIENIAADIKKMDIASYIAKSNYHSTIQQAWAKGNLNISPADPHTMHRGMTPTSQPAIQGNAGNFVPVVYQSASQASERKGKSTRERSDRKHKSQRTAQRVR